MLAFCITTLLNKCSIWTSFVFLIPLYTWESRRQFALCRIWCLFIWRRLLYTLGHSKWLQMLRICWWCQVKSLPHRLWKITGGQEIIYFVNNLFPVCSLYLLKLKAHSCFKPVLGFPLCSVSVLWQTCNTWSLKFRWALLTTTFIIHQGLI